MALNGASWASGLYRIVFRAGYADRDVSPAEGAEEVPERFKQAMKLWVEAHYDRDATMMPVLFDRRGAASRRAGGPGARVILERIKGERYSRVLPLWVDFTAVIIAGGPSLTVDQVDAVALHREANRLRVVVVNDAYLLAPWADLHYAADAKWHRWHGDGIDKPDLGLTESAQVCDRWAAFPGERCPIQASEEVVDDRVHLLKNAHHPGQGNGLSLNPGALVTGRNSGFQALNLAILAGAKSVILLGFDGAPGKDGRSHWHGDHPKKSSPAAYKHFLRSFSPPQPVWLNRKAG